MAPTGRPRTLARLIDVPTDIEGTAERMTIAEAIHREIEATGLQPQIACQKFGVVRELCWNWIKEANDVRAKQTKGHYLTATDLQVLRFHDGCLAAKARWIAERLRIHQTIAAGGALVTEIVEEVSPSQPELDAAGQPVLDAAGRPRPLVLKRRVKQSRTLPDVRALEWELATLAKKEGFAPRVEVTGDEGGPVVVESIVDRALRLDAEIEAYTQGLDDGRAREQEATSDGRADRGAGVAAGENGAV